MLYIERQYGYHGYSIPVIQVTPRYVRRHTRFSRKEKTPASIMEAGV
jgi:hypothetical protein